MSLSGDRAPEHPQRCAPTSLRLYFSSAWAYRGLGGARAAGRLDRWAENEWAQGAGFRKETSGCLKGC